MKIDKTIIRINWDSPSSIKKAEKLKARLEKQGYVLTKNTGGITQAEMTYTKKN